MPGRYVMALDQGTTSSRAILFDERGALVAVDQFEFTQHFPRPGWVEHEQRLVRCARRFAADDAHDLRELLHQRLLRLQAARGIEDRDVDATRDGGSDGVERHCRGVAAIRARNHLAARALAPGL